MQVADGLNPSQGGRTWQPFVGGKNGHRNFLPPCFLFTISIITSLSLESGPPATITSTVAPPSKETLKLHSFHIKGKKEEFLIKKIQGSLSKTILRI